MTLKIALVVPASKLPLNTSCPPLNLGYLASYIREYAKNVEVAIIDGAIGQNVENSLFNFQPDVIGVSFTTPLAYDAYRLGDWIKTNCEDVFIVMGGVHPSVLPEEALLHCDCVVIGEGEMAMLQIGEDIQKKREISRIIKGDFIKDLDAIPSPAFDLMDIESYMKTTDNPSQAFPFGLNHARLGSLITSRGCPWNCIFCYNSFRSTPPRWHSAKRVVDEVTYFIEKYNANSIFFVDDEFAVNKKRLKTISVLFKEYGIDKKIVWGCQARASTLDYETMKLMNGCGCKFVSVGFESANQRMLSLLKNNTITVKQNEQVLVNAKRADMLVGGSFIFGTPTETKTEMLETLAFMENHDELAFMGVNVIIPYPFTKVWETCMEKGLLPKKLDYTKLVPTSNANGAYVVCDTMNEKEFKRLVNDIQRIAGVTQKIRLIYKSSNKPLRDFIYLFKNKFYWHFAVKHPVRIWKLFLKVLRK